MKSLGVNQIQVSGVGNKGVQIKAIQNYERYASEYSSSMSINDYFIEHLMATNEKLDFVRKKKRMARFNTMYRRRLESY